MLQRAQDFEYSMFDSFWEFLASLVKYDERENSDWYALNEKHMLGDWRTMSTFRRSTAATSMRISKIFVFLYRDKFSTSITFLSV